ncbi:TPA: hypothetical protein ACUT5X_000165 [Pseudomonas aeruginosa]
MNYEKIRSKQKEYEKQNYEKILSRTREWREQNREKIRLKNKAYYFNNSERLKEYSKSWKLKNQDRVKAHAKSWASKIQGRHAEIWKKRKEENPQKLIEKRRNYYRKNKKIENSRANSYMKARRRIDPIFRLRCNIRSRISTVLKRQGIGKSSSTAEILGLIARLRAAEADAKRYRWLRDKSADADGVYPMVSLTDDCGDQVSNWLFGKAVDKAVDEAMESTP